MNLVLKTIPLFIVLASGLGACTANEPTPSAALLAAKPTPRPTATVMPLDQPTEQSNKTGLITYDDPTAPFTIQFPAGWKVREEPESIFFQAADQAATIQVIIYEYPEGAPKATTAKDVFDRFTQTFAQGTGLKLTNSITRADASISADIQFQDPATQNPLQGYLRAVLAKNRRYHFIVLFAADQNQFTRYKPVGITAIDSFHER